MLRVTADSNIFISALVFPGGKPSQLLQLASDGKIILTVSRPILDEIADVLSRKFKLAPGEVAEARAFITAVARTVTPAVHLEVIKEDPDDNRVLECAVAAGSDAIVSGDHDLLRLGRYDSIRIVSVSDLLDLVRGEGRKI